MPAPAKAHHWPVTSSGASHADEYRPNDPCATDRVSLIRPHDAAPPVQIPPAMSARRIAGTGRMVWWTGRVAIGLRHQPRDTSGRSRNRHCGSNR